MSGCVKRWRVELLWLPLLCLCFMGAGPGHPDRASRVDRICMNAVLAEMRGDLMRAESGYRRALEADSGLTFAARALFEIGLGTDDLETLSAAGDWYVKHRPEEGSRILVYLEALYEEGLLARLDGILEQLPESDHRPLRIQLDLDRGRHDEARARILEVLEDWPDPQEARVYDEVLVWELVFEWGRRSGRLNEAYALLKEQQAVLEGSGGNFVLARLDWLLGRREDALARLEQALRLDSSEVDAWILLGRLRLNMGDAEGAVEALRAADRLQPGFPEILVPLSAALEALGRMDEAGMLRSWLLKQHPRVQSFWVAYGTHLEQVSDTPQALEVYNRALEIFAADPSPVLLNNTAYLLAVNGSELERALELARRALSAEPESASFLDTLGWVLFQLGRTAEARPLLERASELAPLEPEILEHMGDLSQRDGRLNTARDYWQRALEQKPENQLLRIKLQTLDRGDAGP